MTDEIRNHLQDRLNYLDNEKVIMDMISLMEAKEGVHKVHITGRSASIS